MKYILVVCMVLFFTQQSSAQKSDPYLGIVPAPNSIKKGKGAFVLNAETSIFTDSPNHRAVKFFANYLKSKGLNNSIVNMSNVTNKPASLKNTILLLTNFKTPLPREGYELMVSEGQILLQGRGSGLFYGLQSLLQMVEPTGKASFAIPCAILKDYPRFAYRGMHLDVSRHFFDVSFIKKYLDVMAMYKLNNFHWHLTDDQGWRLEIKKYPNLTKVGSMRVQTKVGGYKGAMSDVFDNVPHGGFYTQEQVKEIVAYAQDRCINVIPEIEMPGHSMAAITAYPIMSCNPTKTYKVGENWGVYNDVLCPSDTTFNMLGHILDEVIDMFPSKMIHIGGDECPKEMWKSNEFCQQLIRDSALRDEHGLKSYFIRRIERYLNDRGRSIIGWDEILEGGLAPNATVMSWRGESGGIAAAQLGHNVIMTPGSEGLYFDHAQSKSDQEPLSIGGHAPLSKTYAYNPVPSVLNEAQQAHILGVQANLWTEYIATPAKAEYMLLPRMLALAEVGWTPTSQKDFANFQTVRIPHHLQVLEAMGYNFRVPESMGIEDTTFNTANQTFNLEPTVEGAKVHYTLDGYTPTQNDLWSSGNLEVAVPKGKKMQVQTIVITPMGKRSNIVKATLQND